MTDALFAPRPWQSPEVTSWGRLPMNAVDRREEAVSLDGRWRFQLLPAPDPEPAWSLPGRALPRPAPSLPSPPTSERS